MSNNRSVAQVRTYWFRTLAVIALTSFSGTALALDMLLVIPGVVGESTDATYPGAINVLAFSWGDSRPAGPSSLSCIQQDLSLTKYVDTATATLPQGLVRGRIYPHITLVVRMLGGPAPVPYLTFDMINAQLTSLSTGGARGGPPITEKKNHPLLRPTYHHPPPPPLPLPPHT